MQTDRKAQGLCFPLSSVISALVNSPLTRMTRTVADDKPALCFDVCIINDTNKWNQQG